MNRPVLLLWLLTACGVGLFRLGTIYIFRSYAMVPLIGLAVVACLTLLVGWRWAAQARASSAPVVVGGALAAAVAGWLIVPPLAFFLLLAPFPQRWGIVGRWTATAQTDRPLHVEQRFSPWGTLAIYRDGELRAKGRYVFLDDQTIEVERRELPRQITRGPQYDVYQLEVTGDTLSLTWLPTNRTTTYRRGAP
jgi:hypothetical protein